MAAITFVAEPSLQQKNSRARALLASDVRAHASKHVHTTRGIYYVPGRLPMSRRAIVRKKQREIIHSRAAVARLPLRNPADPSTYVQRAYADHNAVHINNLCEYFIHLAGPAYVWNLCDSDFESQQFRKKMITWILTQPAISEALLAWMQCQWDRKTGNSNAPSARTLTHQYRSLATIRKAIDDPNTMDPWVMHWAIVAQLVLNQECEDWTSFKVNLAGLNSIIARLGGMKVLQQTEIRAYIFVGGLQTVLNDRDSPTPCPKYPATQIPRQSDYPEEGKLPRLIIKLLKTGDLSTGTADDLCNAICWLRWHDCSGDNSWLDNSENKAITARKAHIEAVLLKLIESRTISSAEFVLCLGALLKFATTRFRTDLWQKLCRGSRVPSWFGQLQYIAGNDLSHEMKLLVLWTALSVLEMPVNISPGYGRRVSFLKTVMSSFPAHLTWDQVCEALSEIHLSKQLWPIILTSWKERKPQVTSPTDKKTPYR